MTAHNAATATAAVVESPLANGMKRRTARNNAALVATPASE